MFGLNTKAAHLNLSDRGSDGGICRGYWLLLPVLAHPELKRKPDTGRKASLPFHQLGPLGRVGLVVALCVCLFVPFLCYFLLGLSLALR